MSTEVDTEVQPLSAGEVFALRMKSATLDYEREIAGLPSPPVSGREVELVAFVNELARRKGKRAEDARRLIGLWRRRTRGQDTVPFGFQRVAGELVEDENEQRVIQSIRALRADGVEWAEVLERL